MSILIPNQSQFTSRFVTFLELKKTFCLGFQWKGLQSMITLADLRISLVYPQFNERAATSEFDSKNQTERKRFVIGLISFLLNIILIVAFLYAALSLFYVGIGVVFLYIISPLGLVAYMITKTGIKSNILEVIKNAWWSNLWGYTFFTPVFLGWSLGSQYQYTLLCVFWTVRDN